ncbi:hypothetical protein BN59_01625 [Legionella massiliensis]|uniref:Uncharacterized protein n=1 Tax=Legionella massiliensis TaxID=1034943 RepID=A0A078KWG6_9GAMM|nr:hypothetical protein BN59_01625 [Legionella massiliensis]CEE13080.1 hypothetical protein BN1094_01625 [Legionella massiliensis]
MCSTVLIPEIPHYVRDDGVGDVTYYTYSHPYDMAGKIYQFFDTVHTIRNLLFII